MKVVFNLLAAVTLIMLGLGLALSGLHAMPGAAADAAAPVQLVGYGTDRDTYSRGDTAHGYLTLKNTGSAVINDVTVSVSVSRSVPVLGTMSLGSKDYKLTSLGIGPGETKKAEFSVSIPKEFHGFSTAGDYDVNGNVLVGGKQAGSFSKRIKVT